MASSIFDARRYPRLPPRLLANSRVLPDRNDILPLLPKSARIVEVGVGFGDFSRLIIDACLPAHFVAIDLFTLHEQENLWGRDTREVFGGATHEQAYRTRFAPELAAGRMTVLTGDSAACLGRLEDASVDVVYLDADHTYDGVVRDLAALRPKLRADGWLVLNDYAPSSIGFPEMPYGVIQACHEFMVAENWEMTHLALAWAMYCDVVLRKVGVGPGTV